jgi:hypothetical protein
MILTMYVFYLDTDNDSFDTMVPYSTRGGSAPHSVAISDSHSDNRLDNVVTNSETNNVVILRGFGCGTFETKISHLLEYDYRPYSIDVTDMNQDRCIDMIIAC